jgi:hypothetical protein
MSMRISGGIAATALLAVCACSDYNFRGSMIEDVFYQEPSSMVDILFVIDNSVSMAEEQADVANNFSEFIANIEETNSDWQIGVVTTDMVDPKQRGRLQGDPEIITPDTPFYQTAFFENITGIGTEGYPIERGLSAAVAAVTPPLATHENDGFIRDGANLSIIVVSDENDCSDGGGLVGDDQEACYQEADQLIPVPQFATNLWASKTSPRDVTFSAVVELDSDDGYAACGEASTGHRYLKLAAMTGGITRSICGEYDNIMDEMGLSVSGIRASFPLTRTPDVCSMTVAVDDIPILRDDSETDGWTYEPENNYLMFWGPAVPARGSTILATYQGGNGDNEEICEEEE